MLNLEVNVALAKLLMKRCEVFPQSPEVSIGSLNEIFQHEIFVKAPEAKKRELMLKSSGYFYKDEMEYPWDNYFDIDIAPLLAGKHALDLGCFTGGRSVAWIEKYRLASLVGIDVGQTFIDAAKQFAKLKNVNAEFALGKGESLQFSDEQFDAILSFETFEHIQNAKKTLSECYRILKPGGKLFVVFPSYFHPTGHHLGLVTNFPCIQWLFSGETLVKAYYDILESRGDDAYWYRRESRNLASWERGNTINGTTVHKFASLVRDSDFRVVLRGRKPIGSVGRTLSRKKIGTRIFYPLTFIPSVQELFLHRITYILEKPVRQGA